MADRASSWVQVDRVPAQLLRQLQSGLPSRVCALVCAGLSQLEVLPLLLPAHHTALSIPSSAKSVVILPSLSKFPDPDFPKTVVLESVVHLLPSSRSPSLHLPAKVVRASESDCSPPQSLPAHRLDSSSDVLVCVVAHLPQHRPRTRQVDLATRQLVWTRSLVGRACALVRVAERLSMHAS